ncbi:hypothetical protein F5Y15DRAFT_377191 [Xylariaceae sp. FL0016]|nr:hypothetical protein F5Y15DRAFT_377191 [Xylariaceae sp. FL0016]
MVGAAADEAAFPDTDADVVDAAETTTTTGAAVPLLLRLLPALRRVQVGFTHRWQDVVVLEGRQEDVVEEIVLHRARLSSGDHRGDGDNGEEWAVLAPGHLHPGLEAMVVETARATEDGVRVLEEAGVEVVWVHVLGRGVMRRVVHVVAPLFLMPEVSRLLRFESCANCHV